MRRHYARLAELLRADRRRRRGMPHPAPGPHPLPRTMPPTFRDHAEAFAIAGTWRLVTRTVRTFLHRDPITRGMKPAHRRVLRTA